MGRDIGDQMEEKMKENTEKVKWTAIYRESFSDFRKRYGMFALISAALVLLKYICFYFFMGVTNHLVWVCALSCLFVFLFFCAFKRKWIPFVIYLLVSILMFADVLYHGYYNAYLTIKIINSAKMIGDITASIQELIKPQYFVLFADNLMIFVTLIFSAVRRRKNPCEPYCARKKEKSYDIPKALKVFVSCFLVLFMIFNPLGSNFVASVSAQELMTYHVRDLTRISDSGDGDEPYYIATGTYENSLDGDLFGVAEGKNLIVIQMEAFQNFAINREYNGQELTPFLNSLINDGETVYFDHYYYQVGSGNTSDAEFATNNSILGTMDSYTYTLYTQNYFKGLPVLLKEQGYDTAAMHAYEKTFWNRENMYPSLGFDHFFDSDYYDDDEDYTGWSVVATNDKNFYHQSIEAMETLSQPFYAFMITLSGHHPFQQKSSNCHIRLKNSEKGTIVGDYLNTVRYEDEALEAFFDELKESGLYEDSIICIYGDHYGLSCTDPEIKEAMTEILGEEYSYKWHFNIPLVINIPGSGVNETISTAGGQLDFMPTVSYLMGLEKLDTIYLGQNLFTAEKGFAAIQQFLNKGSFIDDDVVFRYSGDDVFTNSTAWDADTAKEVSIDGYEDETLKSKQYASLSEFYLKYNVLDKVLNKGMSIDEILSGMDSKGMPLRISMPLSSLAKKSDAADAKSALDAAYKDGYRYIEVNVADDSSFDDIIHSGMKDENKKPYTKKTLMRVSEVCDWMASHQDASLILNPVADETLVEVDLKVGRADGKESEKASSSSEKSSAAGTKADPKTDTEADTKVDTKTNTEADTKADSKTAEGKTSSSDGKGQKDDRDDEDAEDEDTVLISDAVTDLYEVLMKAARKQKLDLSHLIWAASDMDYYAAASDLGYENIIIEPDMSAYDIYKWNNFFMSYHPWAIFLPEKVSSLYMNDLQASSSVVYLVQDGVYDDAHQERMELTEAYGEVTFDQEAEGQTEKEIMEILSDRRGDDGESVNLISRSLRYLSNGRHIAAGLAVIFAVSMAISLFVWGNRIIKRRRAARREEMMSKAHGQE